MKYDINSIPKNYFYEKAGFQIPEAFQYQGALRWDYNFRHDLLKKFQDYDNNINGNCLRAITAELINFVDGERSIKELSKFTGFEYDVNLNPEYVLEFFIKLKEEGQIQLYNKP